MTGETKENKRTVDVIIPVYKPDAAFDLLLERLDEQSYPIERIIVMNTEQSFWEADKYNAAANLEVHHISKEEFDHGETRNRGAAFSVADIIVFMTDDAVPADKNLIKELVKGLEGRGPAGAIVAACFARQLPNRNCAPAERFTRSFNYPDQSLVKTKSDLERMGIKTFFASNVCCAYDRKLFTESGGFTKRTIFNEDMVYAGRAILYRGQAVAYAAEAKVIHSHNYGCVTQLKRNFDLAVSQADHPEVFGGIRSEKEGIKLVMRTGKWLMKQKKPWLIPGLIVKSGFKYIGYMLGKRYRRLPGWLILRITMNREYWRGKF